MRQLVRTADQTGQMPDRSAVAVLNGAKERMRDVKKKDNETESPKKAGKRPDWASGLRQLYDSVVEEPLPDSFNDLLSKLDSDE